MKKISKRRCNQCKKTLPLDRFYKDVTKSLGHSYTCKDCHYKWDTAERKRKLRLDWNKNNKEKVKKAISAYHKRNPEKQKARVLLLKAVKNGDIERQPCQVCKDPKSHAHHPDYSKPLNVLWLCPLHHQRIHFGRLVLP